MKLEAAIALAVGISVPILLGLATYVYQEWQNRKTHLAEHREEVYATLIRNLVGLLGTKTAAERSRLLTEIERAWLFASDGVLEACYAYIDLYDDYCGMATTQGRDWSEILAELRADPDERNKLRDKLVEVFVAMRLDLRGRKRGLRRRPGTTIGTEWAHENFDIYCWGILAAVEEDGLYEGAAPARAANSAAGSS